jgi:hypothetical protein
MQGASHRKDNKWSEGVNVFLQQYDVDYCCLQESGIIANSYEEYGTTDSGVVLYKQKRENKRGPGRNLKYVVYYEWDVGGKRNNLAVVSFTKVQPRAVRLLYPKKKSPTQKKLPVWRPALGVDFGRFVVFSLHAISPEGPDVWNLLHEIGTKVKAPWIAAGDYNRQPDTVTQLPPGAVLRPPDGPTHSATDNKKGLVSKFDYCTQKGILKQDEGKVLGTALSDHLPVLFEI